MKRRITVIGSSNIDLIMQLQRLPVPGETVGDGRFTRAFGGKGANQAVAAARLGGEVTFITCLGNDAVAPEILQHFARDGMDTSHVLRDEDMPTGTALVLVDAEGRNSIALAPGANDALLPEQIEARADVIAGSAMLMLQMETPLATNRRVLELAEAHRVPLMLNYAPIRDRELALSAAITWLVVNEIEAESLCGMPVSNVEQAHAAAEALRTHGPRCVVITLGANGVVLAAENLRAHVPAFPVQPVDTTAAGDCFCGALAVALVEGMPLEQAARFASAAAAISVTRVGAQPSLPARAELERLGVGANPA